MRIIVLSLAKSFNMLMKLLLFIIVYFSFMAIIPLKYMKGKSYICFLHNEAIQEANYNLS